MVGAVGFELTTPCTPCRCATRLRYAPNKRALYGQHPDRANEIQRATKNFPRQAAEE